MNHTGFPDTSHCWGRTLRLVALVTVIVLVGSLPAFPGALALEDVPEPTATLAPEPTATFVPEPTVTFAPEPTATLVPEPTATLAPEPTATLVPEPTATLVPEPTATSEPTATPTSEPTVTATSEPTAILTSEATVTATSEPTAAATPPPDPGFSMQSVVGGGCTQASATDVVELGQSVTFTCPAVQGTTDVSYRRSFSVPSSGWHYQVDGGGFTSAATASSPTLASAPAMTIDLQPIETASPGTSGSLTITIESCLLTDLVCTEGWQALDTTTIGATMGCLTVLPSASAQSIDFGTVVWDGSGYPTVQRSLTISILGPAGCSTMADTWSIQVGTPGMTGPGGTTIPASAMAYAGSGGSVPTGMAAGSGRQPLNPAGTVIATGSSTVPNGSQWTILLALAPPSDTPPGAYMATISIDIVSAGL